ncbi:Pr6Pr family membrane protein [Mesorhizobium xinjiangense]|uniref:Pr6Pr family membrane protein n=1 Tax=Mesorhizobium xinjiangense TaxID=2678685 RepID=UPI0012EDE5FF|nr:Pr6Pr family membrane protein [Mesorhizobium xinjiangense]
MARLLNIAGIVVGLFVLVLQFVLMVPALIEAGRSYGGAIVDYFSFFTILTNILMVITHMAALFARPAFFRRASVRGGVLAATALVVLVYWTILKDLWHPTGMLRLSDVILHAGAPAILLLWWLLDGADGQLSYRQIPSWMIYPVAYVGYAMIRAPIAGEVPYPFLDVTANGWLTVIATILIIAAVFVAMSAVIVLLDRLAGKGRRSTVAGERLTQSQNGRMHSR